MKILKNCKILLSCIGLTKELDISIGVKFKVPRAIFRCFTIVVLVLGTFFEILLCVKFRESGIYAVLFPLHITITILSMLLIYVGLLWRTNEIVELFDYLEHVVIQRKFLHLLKFFPLLSFQYWRLLNFLYFKHFKYFHQNKGTQRSKESGAIYSKRNEINEKFVRMTFLCMILLVASSFFPPTMFGLCYVVFGWPSKNYWYSPIGMVKV